MALYGQEPEVRVLAALAVRLGHRSMIDVGAERGDVAHALLQAGIERVYALESHPGNAEILRQRFNATTDMAARVVVHECAVSDADGHGELHIANAPDGAELPFGHTLLDASDTDEIAWKGSVKVVRRSLASLIDAKELPRHTGILKIDTEGHDLAVIDGMGPLEADVVMVEHWTELTHGLGICPWTADDLLAALEPRGFNHFAFIAHQGEFVTLKWDDADIERDAMGNLIFLHDRIIDRALPDVLRCASVLTEHAVRVGQLYARAAGERQVVIEELVRSASERQAVIDELSRAADERLALVEELHEIAAQRLAALEAATAQLNSRSAE